MTFLKELEAELQGKIDEILNHSYLKRMQNKELSEADLKIFAREYGIYCMYFPRFLAAIASNVSSDIDRFALIENLWEEHGEGDEKKSHRNLYFKFSSILGVTEKNIDKMEPLISTTICVENLMYMCKNAHYIMSMGAMGLGTEYFTSDEYKIILNALESYDLFDKDDLEFWSVHISLDDGHYADMMKSVEPYLEKAKYRKLLKKGAERAIELEIMFWDGLEENYLEI